MTTADDSAAEKREHQDVWAEAVAEQAAQEAAAYEAELKAAREHETEHEPVPMAKAEPAEGERESGEKADAGSELPFGADLGPLVDEVRRFANAVGEKVSAVSSGAQDPMEVLQNLAAPLRSKSPAVYGHLLAAGGELIAAYRAAVSASERRWSAPKKDGPEHIDLD